MPDGVPPMVTGPFEVLIPMIVNTVLFIGLDLIVTSITGSGLTNLVFVIFSPILSAANTLPSMTVIVTLIVIFWFFGIHGDNMLNPIAAPIFNMYLIANIEAYNSGLEIPYVFAGSFTFITGLSIIYLAILFNLNFICKNKRLRSLGRLSIPSSVFNINEPLVFGVPTVLNVLTFIPSIICVILDIIIAYGATVFGFMNKVCMSVPWTTPGPLFLFLSTMDIRAVFVWLIIFVLNVVIFLPFMKAYDKQMDLEETQIQE